MFSCLPAPCILCADVIIDIASQFTIGMSLGLLVGTDFFIASTLIFYLYQSRTGFTRYSFQIHSARIN